MTNYKRSEAMKEIRVIAKKNGLTFKQMRTMLNGEFLWMFVCRETGQKMLENMKFWTAYEDCLSGYIDNFKGFKKNNCIA